MSLVGREERFSQSFLFDVIVFKLESFHSNAFPWRWTCPINLHIFRRSNRILYHARARVAFHSLFLIFAPSILWNATWMSIKHIETCEAFGESNLFHRFDGFRLSNEPNWMVQLLNLIKLRHLQSTVCCCFSLNFNYFVFVSIVCAIEHSFSTNLCQS